MALLQSPIQSPLPSPLQSPAEAVRWFKARGARALQADSRAVNQGDAFIAWPGAATDGRSHVAAALAQGAAGCLVEHDGVEQFGFAVDASIASYAGLKAATGPIAAAYYENPSERLDVLAITGTNGKTSCAWWLSEALSNSELSAHAPCGLVGTLGIGVAPDLRSTGLTTPDPVTWQRELRNFADLGFRACAVEASSIGIAERRLDGTRIAVALFTNFTQDHLDYHGSMDAYWQAKAELFRWPGLRAAVVGIDDLAGRGLAAELGGHDGHDGDSTPPDLWTYAIDDRSARLSAGAIVQGTDGLGFEVVEQGAPSHRLETRLIGRYNVANLLGVIGCLRALDVPLADAVAACTRLSSVPGRMERIAVAGQPLAVIDYAHTPDALDKALAALRPLANERGGRLWCVFGCGGDRDPVKRPMMAAVAEKQADQVVVTSDNPRSEKPDAIIGQILLGLASPEAAQVAVDRAEAIAATLAQAAPEDTVLIAGRGHEAWQDIGGERIAFSDSTHAAAALAQRTMS